MASRAPSSPAVLLRDAIALSGPFPLLAGVDLEVASGETVLVEGPNGAGKTSVLRVCAGLVPLSSGHVAILGLDPVRHRTVVRRRIGLLAHNSHLYDDLSVTQNVRFAVRASGADVGRIGPACDRVGLIGRVLRTPASKLSAGQRRRVALAILVARWPDLWLLDEPHAGLDAATRATLNELITEASSGGTTVVIASHEPEYSQSLAGRAVTIIGGRVTAERRIGSTGSESAPPEPEGSGAAAGASAPAALRVTGGAGSKGPVAHVA
jgi:heme ABC exporter ATP-binding subunit CcmA